MHCFQRWVCQSNFKDTNNLRNEWLVQIMVKEAEFAVNNLTRLTDIIMQNCQGFTLWTCENTIFWKDY